jgi:hypothetical protein
MGSPTDPGLTHSIRRPTSQADPGRGQLTRKWVQKPPIGGPNSPARRLTQRSEQHYPELQNLPNIARIPPEVEPETHEVYWSRAQNR